MNAWDALGAARDYLRENPAEVPRALRNALSLKVGVPIAALRYLGQAAERSGKVRDLRIDPVPPGIRVTGAVDLMKTPTRVATTIYVDHVDFNNGHMRFDLRLEGTSLAVDGTPETPIAALIKSGALDLSKPGNLLKYLPSKPAIIVEAVENRICIDLARGDQLQEKWWVPPLLEVITSFFTLGRIESDQGHLEVAFRALPTGFRGAFRSVRKSIVERTLSRFLP